MPGYSPPGVGAGQALTAKRSVRLLTPRKSSIYPTTSKSLTPPYAYDPPRSPKDGFEWVWFPAGYWAERQIVEMPSTKKLEPTTSNAWTFAWRKRSSRERMRETSSSPEDREDSSQSPAADDSPKPYHMPPLASPYLSEAAHVRSLQQPDYFAPRQTSSSGSESSMEEKPKKPRPTMLPGVAETPSEPSQRRSYFHLVVSSHESASSLSTRANNGPSEEPSLSPKSIGGAGVSPLHGPPVHLERQSNGSLRATQSYGAELSSRAFASSPLRAPASTTLLESQAQMNGRRTLPLASPSISSRDANPPQSFMKKLMHETKPVGHPTSTLIFSTSRQL